MQGIRRESFLTNPPRQVSTTFVRFQWGNGSHCHECLNKPTLPRSIVRASLPEGILRQTNPHDARHKIQFRFPQRQKEQKQPSIFHSSPSNAVQPHSEQTNSKVVMVTTQSCVLDIRRHRPDFFRRRVQIVLNRVAVQAESPDPCSNLSLRDATEDSRLGSRWGQCSCGACAPGCRCRAPAAQTQIHDC